MTLKENITFPLEVCGATDEDIMKRSTLILRKMDLTKRANALPGELSAGERARTAIARAIVHSPMIVLADEPTGNLDPDESLRILRLLQDVNKDGTTVILATHDSTLVDAANTRVIRLDEGRITRDSEGGYHRTATPEVKEIHKVFETNTLPKKKESTSGWTRKIKVTSIGR